MAYQRENLECFPLFLLLQDTETLLIRQYTSMFRMMQLDYVQSIPTRKEKTLEDDGNLTGMHWSTFSITTVLVRTINTVYVKISTFGAEKCANLLNLALEQVSKPLATCVLHIGFRMNNVFHVTVSSLKANSVLNPLARKFPNFTKP
jgi:hypothetical protein